MQKANLKAMASVDVRPVPWLWKPYLAFGMLNVLSGEPGAGNSLLAFTFAVSLSTGQVPFSEEKCPPVDVVYVCKELSHEYLRGRFARRGGNLGRLQISDDLQCLTQTAARLAILDPIQSFVGEDVNNRRSVLEQLAELAAKRGICVLAIRRSSQNMAQRGMLGNIDLTALCRSELYGEKRGRNHVLQHIKSNLGPIGPSLEYRIRNGVLRRAA